MSAGAPAPHTAPAGDSPISLDGYQLRLATFEGPLDVLLRLIERERLAIAEVSLVAVTDGFLAYTRELRNAPPPLLAEFAAVAGRLLVLKSRSLLPRPTTADDEAEPSDLARELAAHRALRDAAVALGELDRLGLGSFPVGSSIQRPTEPEFRLVRHAPSLLANAIRRRLATSQPSRPHPPAPRVVSLADMVRRFLGLFRQASSVKFGDVLSVGSPRDEALAAFLALLILIRRKITHANQSELFGSIEVRLVEAPSSAMLADLVRSDDLGLPR